MSQGIFQFDMGVEPTQIVGIGNALRKDNAENMA